VVQALGEKRQKAVDNKKPSWVADNDDCLPNEILAIIDAMARAAARRDHAAAMKEIVERD
jgi:hypothetical protein